DAVYALCRPPGHHAYRDLAGGFCFLNNSAIAAEHLRQKHERVAILDVDVHHGNGTQGIFYERPDVFTISIHADPSFFYPFVWGYAHERGAGAGLGANFNIPLPRGTGDDGYMQALATAVQAIRAFAPGALVVALGLRCFRARSARGPRGDNRRVPSDRRGACEDRAADGLGARRRLSLRHPWRQPHGRARWVRSGAVATQHRR